MADQPAQQLNEALTAINQRNKTMMILVIVVAVLSLIGTGGTAAYLLLFKEGAATAATEEPKDEHAASAEESTDPAVIDEAAPLGPTFAIDEIVVNLDGEDANRFLKFSLVLEMVDEEALKEAEARLPQLKDIAITLASSKTYIDLQGADGKYRLREELRFRYNKVLKGKIGRLYFTNLVVQ